MIISSTFASAGEKIEWRGFLLPQMKRYGNSGKQIKKQPIRQVLKANEL
jgi:hypothetical protein